MLGNVCRDSAGNLDIQVHGPARSLFDLAIVGLCLFISSPLSQSAGMELKVLVIKRIWRELFVLRFSKSPIMQPGLFVDCEIGGAAY